MERPQSPFKKFYTPPKSLGKDVRAGSSTITNTWVNVGGSNDGRPKGYGSCRALPFYLQEAEWRVA